MFSPPAALPTAPRPRFTETRWVLVSLSSRLVFGLRRAPRTRGFMESSVLERPGPDVSVHFPFSLLSFRDARDRGVRPPGVVPRSRAWAVSFWAVSVASSTRPPAVCPSAVSLRLLLPSSACSSQPTGFRPLSSHGHAPCFLRAWSFLPGCQPWCGARWCRGVGTPVKPLEPCSELWLHSRGQCHPLEADLDLCEAVGPGHS